MTCKRRIAIILVLALIVSTLSGCGASSGISKITEEDFWNGLSAQGYEVDGQYLEDYLAIYDLADYGVTESNVESIGYYDGNEKYIYVDFVSNSAALNLYNGIVNTYQDSAKNHFESEVGTKKMWRGDFSETEQHLIMYRCDSMILIGCGEATKEGRKELKQILLNLMSGDYDKSKIDSDAVDFVLNDSLEDDLSNYNIGSLDENNYVADIANELVNNATPDSQTNTSVNVGGSNIEALAESNSQAMVIGNYLLQIDGDGTWEFGSSYTNIVVATADNGDIDLTYSNSFVNVGDEDSVVDYLKNVYSCTSYQPAEINERASYIGIKTSDYGYINYYIYQNIGIDTYLLIQVTSMSGTLTSQRALERFCINI